MKPECRNFRAELERRLAETDGRPPSPVLSELGWHEHLLACAACKDVLAGEEALDELLASLPEPRLPRRLTERLLARLRTTRENDLDALLALDAGAEAVAPADLAPRVAQGVRERQARAEAALDRLLDRVPAAAAAPGLVERVRTGLEAARAAEIAAFDALLERVPVETGAPGLAERVRAGVAARADASERRLDVLLDRAAGIRVPVGLGDRALARLRASSVGASRPKALVSSSAQSATHGRGRALRSRWVWAAAAGLIVALAAWLVWPRPGGGGSGVPIVREERSPRGPGELQKRAALETPESDVLAALDVLEQWDLLMKDDVDVLLSTFAPADESLLDVESLPLPAEELPGETEPKTEGRKG